MLYKNLDFFKILIFVTFFIISIFFIFKGYKELFTNAKYINNVNSNDLIINQELISNEVIIKSKIKKSNNKTLLKKNTIIIKENDTFSKIIEPFFENKIKNQIINKLNKIYNLKYLKIGQKILFYENNKNEIYKIILHNGFDTDIVINIKNDKIEIQKQKNPINTEINSINFIISSSLYKNGIEANVPVTILHEAIKLYSFDIDFQRDIRKNTIVEIAYEIFSSPNRDKIEYGSIQYINLIINNKNLEYYIFKTDEGFFDYFNKEGKNVKKSLLKTPIDGAKLSSNFGMRKHPISGFNKLHKGVDFAAPTGTPIYAGGNGVIEYLGNNGGYGKYIRIRHNNNYKTAYAHLSKFQKNMSKGKRVNQGDVIGYVGNTGKSTGPHLHYEIIFQNKQINPMTMKLPSGKVLVGSELKRFVKNANEINAKHLFNLYE